MCSERRVADARPARWRRVARTAIQPSVLPIGTQCDCRFRHLDAAGVALMLEQDVWNCAGSYAGGVAFRVAAGSPASSRKRANNRSRNWRNCS